MTACNRICNTCCRAVRDFIYFTPIMVVASLVTAVALQVIFPALALPFWAYVGAAVGVQLLMKQISKCVNLTNCSDRIWYYNNEYGLQPILLGIAVVCCTINPLIGAAIGGITGAVRGLYAQREVYMLQLELNQRELSAQQRN